jgi:hypothetical protein
MRKTSIILTVFLSFFVMAGTDHPATNQSAGDNNGWKEASMPGFIFKYKVNGDKLDCSLKAGSTGWVAVGFNTVNRMNEARMIFACVDKTGLHIEEQVAKGHSHHKIKTQKLDNLFGEERNGQTEVGFTILLNNGDKESLVLKAGNKYNVLLATSGSDSFAWIHSRRTVTAITL